MPALTATSSFYTDKPFLAYPNPARQRLVFSLNLARDAHAEVWIYNLCGERVAVLKAEMPAGQGRTLVWDCSGVAPGVYLARFLANGEEIGKQKTTILR
jgi:hypothetical protein